MGRAVPGPPWVGGYLGGVGGRGAAMGRAVPVPPSRQRRFAASATDSGHRNCAAEERHHMARLKPLLGLKITPTWPIILVRLKIRRCRRLPRARIPPLGGWGWCLLLPLTIEASAARTVARRPNEERQRRREHVTGAQSVLLAALLALALALRSHLPLGTYHLPNFQEQNALTTYRTFWTKMAKK